MTSTKTAYTPYWPIRS